MRAKKERAAAVFNAGDECEGTTIKTKVLRSVSKRCLKLFRMTFREVGRGMVSDWLKCSTGYRGVKGGEIDSRAMERRG
jgi:hypothetical protein